MALGFSKELFKFEPDGWRGPVRSGFRLAPGMDRHAGARRIPDFDEVQGDVKTAWTDAATQEIGAFALEEMSANYTVAVPDLATIDMSNLLETNQAPTYSPEVPQ